MARLRCAIYTRKSTEEGLDQAFNSLQAQREACEAYIRSQAGEGWTCLKTAYDDGGFSGGSMERPALRALLDDILAGNVDVVVVYKVDRLTRSLADFAKIVDVFDARGVSFVSVTQAFNTTTSMGRLTLNVLLSFAQFEREVIGERIRDKIAATRAKGMWVGGSVPIGYEVIDRALVVHQDEAARVQYVFRRYLELDSVHDLILDLRAQNFPPRVRPSRNGKPGCGSHWGRGAVMHLLQNPVYRGLVRHKEKLYPGLHEAIIEQHLWEAVQAKLASHRRRTGPTTWRSKAGSLAGRVFDDRGNLMSPVRQPKNGAYLRYYVSRAVTQRRRAEAGSLPRVRADKLEEAVTRAARRCGAELETVSKIVVAAEWVELSLPSHTEPGETESHRFDMRLRQRGRTGPALLDGAEISPRRPNEAVLLKLARGRRWAEEVEAGERASIAEIAAAEGVPASAVLVALELAWSSPRAIEAMLAGV